MDESKVCVIHTTEEDPHTGLTTPRDFESWTSLLRAAKLRQHEGLLTANQTTPEGEIPEVFYHPKCRKLFTMKRDLDKLVDDGGPDAYAEEKSSAKRKSLRQCTSSSHSTVLDKVCIFCPPGKSSKYIKGTRTREPLTKCVELQADDTIRKAATKRQDQRILAIVARELVAAEAWYHKSCYKLYTNTKELGAVSDAITEDESESLYKVAHDEAFEQLIQYIRKDLFETPRVVSFKDLSHRLYSHMTMNGFVDIKDSTKKNLRRSLETEFGETLHIFPDTNGKLLVFPDVLERYELAKENMKLRREIESYKINANEPNEVLRTAATYLRTVIKSQEKSNNWPYLPDELSESASKSPREVQQFLYALLTGDLDPKSPSRRVEMLVDSYAQDLVYAVSCGSQVPPKHVLLPCVVKALTGNTEVIQMLNRLGHGVSYTVIEENETALCLRKISYANKRVALPENIRPHVFTTLAWDNIDRLEETLTGEGTSHRVNGIAVQRREFGPWPLKESLPDVAKSRKRSLDVENVPLPIYISGERAGPPNLKTVEVDRSDVIETALYKNFVWFLVRLVDTAQQTVMSWTGFNIVTRQDHQISQDAIGYLPTINAPATDMSTVKEILNRSQQIRILLSLDEIVVVCDQALYAKAAEVVWKHPDQYQNVILRMGTFHTICNFLSIIGKRFQDGGLQSIVIEAGVLAEGSVASVLEGRQYNRGVRTHKYVYEALLRLAWREFLLWMQEKHPELKASVEAGLEVIRDLHEDISQQTFEEVEQSEPLLALVHHFSSFLDKLRHNNGPLSEYWMSYIDMVNVLLGLVRASREGNWELHMACIRECIPWCYAYDKTNYARYLTIYYGEMSQLPEQHPRVYQQFKEGHFSVQIGSQNSFGRIPVDQTIEETVNKDTKTPGGTCRFSLNISAVTRYYLTAEYRSSYIKLMRDMLHMNQSDLQHAELHQSRTSKDEKAVSAVLNIIDDLANPFQESQDLINISNATVAPAFVAKDLSSAKERGELAYASFKADRLESEVPELKFHDRIPKMKLKTFTDVKKSTRVKSKSGKELILRTTSNLFGNMLMMAQTRKLDMREILQHTLGPVPWSLATADGKPRKTNKSALSRELKKSALPAEVIPPNSACLIDGMTLVHKTKGEHKTFGDIASLIYSKALNEASRSGRIDIVFDTYREISIKDTEREERQAGAGTIQLKNITSKQTVVQWTKFLSTNSNKTSFISFLEREWRQEKFAKLLGEKILFVTCGEDCFRLSSAEGSNLVPELRSSHEEADTRLMLHAAHAAAQGYESILLVADDTDVLVLSLAFSADIGAAMYVKAGTQSRTQYTDVKKIASALGPAVCSALIGMHAFTGCDSVSTLAGRGKLTALKMLKRNEEVQCMFKDLGSEWTVSEELNDKIEAFTCQMYAPRSNTESVNELRYQLFSAKKARIDPHQLPPCADALQKHTLRANYQSAIWKRSLESLPDIPSPHNLGWKLQSREEKEELQIHWMDGPAAPEAVLELLSCNCPRFCRLPQCTCMTNNLKCSELCRLKTCDNQPPDDDEDNPVLDEEVEDEELDFD